MSASTVERVAAVAAPEKRAKAAADAVRKATAAVDKARVTRDNTAVWLVRAGARPVEVQQRMGMARNQRNAYVRIVQRLGEAPVPDHSSTRNAWRTLDRAVARMTEHAAVASEARVLRDQAAQAMVDAGARSMDVAKATGLTSARVSQMGLTPTGATVDG